MNDPAASGGVWTHKDFVGATHGSPLRNLYQKHPGFPGCLFIDFRYFTVSVVDVVLDGTIGSARVGAVDRSSYMGVGTPGSGFVTRNAPNMAKLDAAAAKMQNEATISPCRQCSLS
jgi:hypothetical protein